MKLTKTQAALEAAQKGKATLAKRMHAEKEEGIRTASMAITGGIIGNLEVSGRMDSIPTLGPLPRTTALAIVAKFAAMFAGPGTFKSVLNGAGDAATVITSYNFTRGASISGYDNRGTLARERAAAEEMERNLERRHPRRDADGGDTLEGALSGL